MTDCGCELEGDTQRRTLRVVLAINTAMFVFEIVAGMLASSTGLIADSLDMLADASCLLYTSPSPRDLSTSRMPSSA